MVKIHFNDTIHKVIKKRLPITLNTIQKTCKYLPKEDVLFKELDILADKYIQDFSIDTKKEILAKEKEMLFQELDEPTLTDLRYRLNAENDYKIKNGEISYYDALQLMNTNALLRLINLPKKFGIKNLSKEQINLLIKIYKKVDESNSVGLACRRNILSCLMEIDDDTFDIFQRLKKITKSEELLDTLNYTTAIETTSLKSEIESLKENTNQENLFKKVITSPTNISQNKEIGKLVSFYLNKEDLSKKTRRYAIWGAGAFRNDINFEKIKQIALDVNEKDIRAREFAIQSISLYLKERKEEIQEILLKIKEENSRFSHLAEILYDKTNGNYHGQVDREIKYKKIDKKEASKFRYDVSLFLTNEADYNLQRKNRLEKEFIPYKNLIERLNFNKAKFYIIKDTYTKIDFDEVATREMLSGLNSGEYSDSVDGAQCNNRVICNDENICISDDEGIVSHEIGHIIHENLNSDTRKLISKLYKNAVANNRTLNYYANMDEEEYFAEGCSAFSRDYISHSSLLIPTSINSFMLEDKDPDLYNLINTLLNEDLSHTKFKKG